MAIEVRLCDWSEATEVILAGVADGSVLVVVAEALCRFVADDKPAVLNLDGLTRLDRETLDAFLRPLTPAGGFRGELAVVCSRPTAAQLLVRWGARWGVPIYRTTAGALAKAASERWRNPSSRSQKARPLGRTPELPAVSSRFPSLVN